MEQQVKDLQINMAKLKTDIGYIKDSLTLNFTQHKEIMSKIDHLSDTFQTRVGDKANECEVRDRLEAIDHRYVTKDSFNPVQKIVYGMAGAILLAFLSAMIYLVIK